jgi:hypothetical protein
MWSTVTVRARAGPAGEERPDRAIVVGEWIVEFALITKPGPQNQAR